MTPLRKAARALALQESGTDSFDGLEPELQAQVIESVKAVLMAVREPSEDMVDVGVAGGDWPHAAETWQGMIDAAIAEG